MRVSVYSLRGVWGVEVGVWRAGSGVSVTGGGNYCCQQGAEAICGGGGVT